jgi:hypothetical protein
MRIKWHRVHLISSLLSPPHLFVICHLTACSRKETFFELEMHRTDGEMPNAIDQDVTGFNESTPDTNFKYKICLNHVFNFFMAQISPKNRIRMYTLKQDEF